MGTEKPYIGKPNNAQMICTKYSMVYFQVHSVLLFEMFCEDTIIIVTNGRVGIRRRTHQGLGIWVFFAKNFWGSYGALVDGLFQGLFTNYYHSMFFWT